MHRLSHAAQDRQTPLIGGHIIGQAKSIEIIIEEPLRGFDEFFEGRAAKVLDKAIGVMPRRDHSYTDGQLRGQQMIERANSSVLAGFIRIKTKNDFLDITF